MSTAPSIFLGAVLFIVARTEFETLYLSGCCFRKFGKEFDPMRAFEDRQSAEHKFRLLNGGQNRCINVFAACPNGPDQAGMGL